MPRIKSIPWLQFLCKLFKSVPFQTKEEKKAEGKFPHCVVKRRHALLATAICVHIAIPHEMWKCELRVEYVWRYAATWIILNCTSTIQPYRNFILQLLDCQRISFCLLFKFYSGAVSYALRTYVRNENEYEYTKYVIRLLIFTIFVKSFYLIRYLLGAANSCNTPSLIAKKKCLGNRKCVLVPFWFSRWVVWFSCQAQKSTYTDRFLTHQFSLDYFASKLLLAENKLVSKVCTKTLHASNDNLFSVHLFMSLGAELWEVVFGEDRFLCERNQWKLMC